MPERPETKRHRRQLRRDMGLCRCGKRPLPGKSRCMRCIDSENRNERYRKQRASEKGLCPRCCTRIPAEGKKNCVQCILYAAAHKRAHRPGPKIGWLVYREWRMQGCADCPPATEWPLACIDAHRLTGHDRPISWKALSAADVLTELDGCIPLCANHHRMRHKNGWKSLADA